MLKELPPRDKCKAVTLTTNGIEYTSNRFKESTLHSIKETVTKDLRAVNVKMKSTPYTGLLAMLASPPYENAPRNGGAYHSRNQISAEVNLAPQQQY
ncbi:hypothetical protein H3221_001670 [Pseudomonas sp. LMG 31766]|jgi:hypothetical protein|uniref:Uncharacterized protein n=1 Tax=Pseudomonas chaetocerotis TaxID=2758695 RepID=A0A931CY79_9PSED|nr:hypothetical protein [Pseudomonas chaetocerotis]MBZ9663452.1 hypothetical protein [Pseudomonas chaetocerotis]